MDETPEQEEPIGYFKKFQDLLEKSKKVAIFTHSNADPDGLGAIMGLGWLLSKLDIDSQAFCSGDISHPQNIAFVNLLDPALLSTADYNESLFDVNALVDTIPSNAGVEHDIEFDLVIDHHKDSTNGFKGLLINLGAGSACATVFDIIKQYGFKFEDGNDYDQRVATAMLVGINTDTDSMMSEDTTEYEADAWKGLLEYREPEALRRIVNYERPKFWVNIKAQATQEVAIHEGVAVVGMGIIPAKHRDVIADMASTLATWEEVHTGIAFAIVGGDRVEGSVRSVNASVIVPDLCKKFGGRYGNGGGKRGKGAYKYPLAGGGIEEEDDDDTKQKVWDLYNEKETKRVQRIIQK